MPADLTQAFAKEYPLLSRLDTPADLRALPRSELGTTADELRRFLIDTISRCGGHFAASHD